MGEKTDGQVIEFEEQGGDRAKALPGGVELHLEVRDPEIVAELLRREAGEERDRYALTALRLGVLSMRMAGGQVDAQSVRSAGKEIISEVRELLTTRGSELTDKVSFALKQYFDPKSGVMQQRIESLVKKDGELERMLKEHMGPEDSTVAKALMRHVGENSPIFKMLSPTDSEGVKIQLENAVKTALEEQRVKVVGQFSLDDQDSALSRLLAEVSRKQGVLSEDIREQIKTLTEEFSSDAEDSALSRLSKLLESTRADIGERLTLDKQDSPLSVLKRSLEETLVSFEKENSEFRKDVRETLAAYQVRKDEAAKSTRHGADFEEQLGAVVSAESQRLGDVFEAIGNTTGTIKNCKVGDYVVALGPESAAPEARIVFEAKEDKSYNLPKALAEIEEGRKNRSAQIGVFIFSQKTVPVGLDAMGRYGSDIVAVWDAENPATDIYVKAAFSVARALTTKEAGVKGDLAAAVTEIETATRAVEKQIKYLDDFAKWSSTIKNNAEKIEDRSKRMRGEIDKQVALLDERIASLKM